MIWKILSAWRVRRATKWIEKFERKTSSELERIASVDDKINTKITSLKADITCLEENQKALKKAETKIANLRKVLGE